MEHILNQFFILVGYLFISILIITVLVIVGHYVFRFIDFILEILP